MDAVVAVQGTTPPAVSLTAQRVRQVNTSRPQGQADAGPAPPATTPPEASPAVQHVQQANINHQTGPEDAVHVRLVKLLFYLMFYKESAAKVCSFKLSFLIFYSTGQFQGSAGQGGCGACGAGYYSIGGAASCSAITAGEFILSSLKSRYDRYHCYFCNVYH